MLRALACVFALTVPLLSQGFSLPFSVSGGGLTVGGSLTSASGVVYLSGDVSIGGHSGSILPCKPRYIDDDVAWYRCQVEIDEDIYVIWISVDIDAPIGHQLGGYWYITGTPETNTLS